VHFLVCWTVLCAGRRLSSAETLVFEGVEGGYFKERFLFHTSGTYMLFCKNDCDKRENILVETPGTRTQSGRYSIEFNKRSNHFILHVGISDLRSSDSGSYRCEIWSGKVMEDSVEFQLEVSGGNHHHYYHFIYFC
ncbi:hypothetical protein NL108_015616, partial [Boleophthalmus pectinirostris]